MIVCKKCGNANEDGDEWCGSCGAFLEFDGEKISLAPEIEAEAAPEPEAKHGIVERVKDAIKGDGDGAAPAPAAAAPAPASAPPPPAGALPAPPAPSGGRPNPFQPVAGSTAPPPPAAAAVQPGAAPESEAMARAARLVAPTPPPQEAPKPEERKPGAAVKKRPAPVAVAKKALRPGDLICGQCGTGNEPTRKFCRKCGESLEQAVQVKIPWYRKLFSRKPKESLKAGERHGDRDGRPRKARGGKGRMLRLFAFAATVLVLFAMLGPVPNPLRNKFNDAYNWAKDQISAPPRVEPNGVAASRSVPGHGPNLLVDGVSNSYWSPGDGLGATATFRFTDGFKLKKMIFTSGRAPEPKDFFAAPRPKSVAVSWSSDGPSRQCSHESDSCKLVTLQDKAGGQTVSVDSGKKVTSITVTILSTYGKTASGNSEIALAEVEFFGRS